MQRLQEMQRKRCLKEAKRSSCSWNRTPHEPPDAIMTCEKDTKKGALAMLSITALRLVTQRGGSQPVPGDISLEASL